jgi:hypothetical protein
MLALLSLKSLPLGLLLTSLLDLPLPRLYGILSEFLVLALSQLLLTLSCVSGNCRLPIDGHSTHLVRLST